MKPLSPALFALALSWSSTAAASWDSALTAIRSEPKVKDVLLQTGVLYVGVLDDGSRREGYAQYICELLREHAVERPGRSVPVHVMDIAKIKHRNDWVKLGSHNCKL